LATHFDIISKYDQFSIKYTQACEKYEKYLQPVGSQSVLLHKMEGQCYSVISFHHFQHLQLLCFNTLFLKYVDISSVMTYQFFISLVLAVSGVKTWMTSCQMIIKLYISVHTVPVSQKERRMSILSIQSICSMCKISISILVHIYSQLEVLTGIL
jgi:hypothetical protein